MDNWTDLGALFAHLRGLADVKRVILDDARGADGVLAEPAPVVRVVGLSDFMVRLNPVLRIDPPQRVEAPDVADRVLEQAKLALTRAGQQILFLDQTEATGCDRARRLEDRPTGSGGGRPQWQVTGTGSRAAIAAGEVAVR